MIRQILLRLFSACMILGTVSTAIADDEPQGVRRVLIICGHPGDDAHHKLFAETIERLAKGMETNLKVSPEHIHLQFGAEPTEDDPEIVKKAQGQATREEIAQIVSAIQTELQPDDSLWVIVMGHAYFDGRNSHLNLPGPDYRADEFAKLFAAVSCREQVFFMTCPVSGYFIKPLTAPFRVVITATEADLEFNETDCAAALADVLSNPPHRAAFDVDQDGELTLFDLYVVLVRRVIERYTTAMAVVTEHSLLEDNGDGRGGEVQVNFLPEEQGGRWKPGDVPAKPKKDGIYSSRAILDITVPALPPEEPPADAASPENPSEDAAALTAD